MQKTILITGSTDGIGLETAKLLIAQGHNVLLHGRNAEKLQNVKDTLSTLSENSNVESYVADLSSMNEVKKLANDIIEQQPKLDVLINNAGILKTAKPITQAGLDVRFAVNTIAPYLLTKKLLPLLGSSGRVVNLSSAAQSPVDIKALFGEVKIADDMTAYAQSKLAITMWSYHMAQMQNEDIVITAINPGSLLATKMVKEGFGIAGNDLSIGANILIKAALSEEFAAASGKYFDNDIGQFNSPHPDALDPQKNDELIKAIETILA